MELSSRNKVPFLSIVMPVYNVENYIGEAIDSVLSQTYRDFEIIAVNDGSTDRSAKILERYAANDGRLRVLHTENRGLSAARNEGSKHASGTAIYFFDSDDLLADEALTELVSLFKENRCDMVAFSGACIDDQSRPIACSQPYGKPAHKTPVAGRKLFTEMMNSGRYSPVVSMYLYSREFLKNYGLDFPEGYIHEDEAFTAKALFLAERVCSTRSVHHLHRIRSGSIMADEFGMKNLEGWAHAVSEMLNFMETESLKGEDRQALLIRARQLAKNCAGILQKLNRETGSRHVAETWFTAKELDSLGFDVKLKFNRPFVYRIYNRLLSLFSIR